MNDSKNETIAQPIDNKNENTSTDVTKVEEVVNETKKDEADSVAPSEDDDQLPVDEIKLNYLDKDFIYDYMSVPTHSREEFRAVTYIILWARKNNVQYEFDKKGNIYLTKGTIEDGEFYPCVTAHLDTVQDKQTAYAKAGVRLDVKTRINTKNEHEIYCEGFGIGGDDKAGVAICLNMFKHLDRLKACFFLEEEIGCQGSKQMNIAWFSNVGFVMGFDSPDLNRAARVCSGEKLFTKEFFEEHMSTIVKKWGLTDFRCEPFTDVVTIREKTDIICMNFGTGYYNCHMANEYCILEHMDKACGMGLELINHLGLKQYTMERNKDWANGFNRWQSNNEDDDYFDEFNGKPKRTSTSTVHVYGPGAHHTTHTPTPPTSGSTSTPSTPSTTTKTTDNTIDIESLKYISDKYEEKIVDIRERLKKICEEKGLNFNEDFASIFKTDIQF